MSPGARCCCYLWKYGNINFRKKIKLQFWNLLPAGLFTNKVMWLSGDSDELEDKTRRMWSVKSSWHGALVCSRRRALTPTQSWRGLSSPSSRSSSLPSAGPSKQVRRDTSQPRVDFPVRGNLVQHPVRPSLSPASVVLLIHDGESGESLRVWGMCEDTGHTIYLDIYCKYLSKLRRRRHCSHKCDDVNTPLRLLAPIQHPRGRVLEGWGRSNVLQHNLRNLDW